MVRVLTGLLCVVFSLSVLAKPGDPKEVKTDRLAGIWLVPDKSSETVSLRLIVLAGEQQVTGAEGLAHYTEHLVASQVGLANKGASLHSNAWTTPTTTVYWQQGHPGKLDAMIKRLSLALEPISASHTFANTEREIVQREYGSRVADQWAARLGIKHRAQLFTGSVVARSTIGSPSTISTYSLESAQDFQARHYTSRNAVLLATGNISARALRRSVQKHFKQENTPDYTPHPAADLGQRMAPVTRTERNPKARSETVWWSRVGLLNTPVAPLELDVQLGVLHDVLVSRLPGGLARTLRFDRFVLAGMDVSARVQSESAFSFFLSLRPDKDVSLDTAQQETRAALEALRKDGVPKDTLDRIKARILDELDDADAVQLTSRRAEYALQIGQAPLSHKAHRRQIAAVKTTDLARLLDALHQPHRDVTYFINPKDEE